MKLPPGANLLMNGEGVLKIADFGLARYLYFPLSRPVTAKLVTLWYRAPEILLGDPLYSFKSDVWSSGIFMIELFQNKVPFTGQKEKEQFDNLTKIFGVPVTAQWPGLNKMIYYKELMGEQQQVQDEAIQQEPVGLEAYLKSKIPK